MIEQMNSEQYWDNRFLTNWKEYDGEGQTAFFAQLMCQMFPQWFVRKIRENKYTICDMGCALGDAVDVLTKYLNVDVDGADFSETAIKEATKKYPSYNFSKIDLRNIPEPFEYDILIASNVLEHFDKPWSIVNNMAGSAKKYIVLMMPYQEQLNIDEHVFKFDNHVIPMQINEFSLVYCNVIDGCSFESTLYPGQQILLIYSNIAEDKALVYISDICNVSTQKERLLIDSWQQEKNIVNTLRINNELLEEDLQRQKDFVDALQIENKSLAQKIGQLNQELKNETEKNNEVLSEKNNIIKGLEYSNAELQKRIEKESQDKQYAKKLLTEQEEKSKVMKSEIEQIYAIVDETEKLCVNLAQTKPFKLAHFLRRLKYQGIKGDKIERGNFRKWLLSKVSGKGGDFDRRYNQLYWVINQLRKIKNLSIENTLYDEIILKETPLKNHLNSEHVRLTNDDSNQKEVQKLKEYIAQRKYKGILVYPHVVYWEPLQTPQQLLRAFAQNGWLCFFCEHPNLPDEFREVESNVIITHEKELLAALGETEVVVLLTWLGSLSFVEQIKNKKIWYHILDKLDLFPYYDGSYLRLHEHYVELAECVSYVAKPLLNCLNSREDVQYLPNGVMPEEFLNIHDDYVPNDMKTIVSSGHKIIGYYGYLAEWMDYEMVKQAALARPEYEFVFIGKSIYDTNVFEGIQNIHLLGLKPYKELSDYAKFFDVATIPFVIDEKMDCVSPIKFYEYCALGLPVVTSRMKEMEQFVCEYIACADNTDEFLFYLDKLTNPEMKELAQHYAPRIATQNAWGARATFIEKFLNKNVSARLADNYSKFDVVIFAIIDYDFRFQRPQHFATRFAENGHRVFYVNSDFYRPASVEEIQPNLFVVNLHNDIFDAIHLTDWKTQSNELYYQLNKLLNDYCIRDAVTIVDYPNWVYAAEYLREYYGFKIITDYMDDFTGFLNPAENLVKENCEYLLKTSDQVVASSQFLYDIAIKYHDTIGLVRNGTEYEHFCLARGSVEHERKVIGYYGAVAEWFDCDKVVYLAKNLPNCDIIIIGHVTSNQEKLASCPNIKLLGEKPYIELPQYLKEFDVCLIPFDTSTDLIKATNPVKFYEYLSAGKKVVATEIPELEPFQDEYVYMSNNDEEFLQYVQLCLDGKDILANEEACMKFAQENDWQRRYEAFAKFCVVMVPKVSIIVLTYNNLKLNKLCIESILTKTAYPNYELIIVDNCSTDGTKEWLQEIEGTDAKLKVILNSDNKGFAAGNNVGIQAASGDYIVLLNNDTIVTRGWLTAMSKHLENDAELGMCGPVTNSIGNEAKIKVDYHDIKSLHQFAYQYTTNHLNEKFEDAKVLALFCTMIKKEVIEQCGLLDESYGIGMFEDDDYAEAVKSKGYSISIAEDSFIHHFEGASFKKLEDEKFREVFEENKKIYENKWNKQWSVHKKRLGVDWDTNLEIDLLSDRTM